MAMTVESLLAPISDDSPAGEDLSYDNDRALLEQAFETSESSSDEAPADQDWRTVLKLIDSQFARTKDLWLAAYLCRAGARSGSLDAVETGAQVLAGLFEQYWASVHPQLEELGVPGRKAPCDSLTTRSGFIAPLEKAVLLAHPRLGAFSGADLNRFRLDGEAAEGYGKFRAALEELGEDSLKNALAQVESIEDGFRRTDTAFMAQAAGEQTPNFTATYAALAALKQTLQHFLPEPAEEVAEEAAATEGGEGGAPATRTEKTFAGAVTSRKDVVRALTAIGDYYRRNEPSHPVQLLIQRAQLWVELDFLSLLREIAPGGVDQAEGLLVSRTPTT